MENQTSFHNRSLCTQAQGAELQDEPAPDPPTWVPSSHQDPGRYHISEGASKNNDFLRQRPENTWELREAAPAPWEAAEGSPKAAGRGYANKRPQSPRLLPCLQKGPSRPRAPKHTGRMHAGSLQHPCPGLGCARAHAQTSLEADFPSSSAGLGLCDSVPVLSCLAASAARGAPLVSGGLATAPGCRRPVFCANTRSLTSFSKGKLFSFRCQCAMDRAAAVGWRQEGPARGRCRRPQGWLSLCARKGPPRARPAGPCSWSAAPELRELGACAASRAGGGDGRRHRARPASGGSGAAVPCGKACGSPHF